MSKVKVVVVGAGWVSTNRHIPALASHPDVEITGLVAPRESLDLLDARFLERYGISALAEDVESDLVSEADAVVIGTPPYTHREVAMKALLQGCHVLIEKPLAMSQIEAAEMVEAALHAGRVLAVVHNLQFSRSALEADALLRKGRIGELTAVLGLQSSNHQRRLPTWYPDLPLGLFSDESPHLIYLANKFAPEMKLGFVDVGNSISVADNTPDVVTMGLRSPNGLPVTIHMSFVGSMSEWALVLQGSEGTLAIDLFRDILIHVPNDGRHVTRDVLTTTAAAFGHHLYGVAKSGVLRVRSKLDYGNGEVVQRFVSAVQTGRPPQGISAGDGVQVVEIIDATVDAKRGPRSAGDQ